ncbi:sensor histidine kinase [Kocuria sabuli]|uniref:sensor histidine kinase n=1 Tax=Kocuria sabuli TaxID=3071448 RepID=UPI0034D5AD6F
MWSALWTPWVEPAMDHPPPRGRADWALAAVVAATAVLEALVRRDLVWPPVAVALGCGLAAAVLFRRTRPLLAVVLAFGGSAALDAATFAAGTEPVVLHSGAVVLVLVYSLFRWGAGREAAIGLGIMAVGLLASVTVDFPGTTDTIGGAAVLLLTAALGLLVRYRAAARAHLVAQARSQERAQLARELHDTVAHHVSAIAIQAQAGLFLARSSSLGGATEALEVIEGEAARTLAEMRAMVGVLRDRQDGPAMSPRRRIAHIQDLAADGTHSLPVDVELHGDLTDLPPALESALYRVAQEAVTNARRHAHRPARVRVELTGDERRIRMTVSDDGAHAPIAPHSSGYGLVGMAERVELLGGTFTAGPDPDRGWSVRAVLPRGGPAT